MQIEKLNIKNSTSNDFNPIIINNIFASLKKPTCLTYPLKLKYPPCKTYREKQVGGQLAALGMSVAETVHGYATGALKGLGGMLNVATSAIGAGASWLGNAASSAFHSTKEVVVNGAKTLIDTTSTIMKAVGTVAKNVVTGVGNFVNSGFKVGKSDSLNWSIKQARKFESDAWVGVAGGIAGDWTGDIIGNKAGFNIGNKRISYGKLASGFARETIDYAHTGQFDVNVISMGAIQDSIFGRAKFGEGGGGFLSQMGNSFAENLYYSDADISGFRNTGFGFSINNKGKWGSTHNVSGGFDISDITIAAVQNPMAFGKTMFNAAKGLAFGISKIGKGVYNLAQNTIFDREQERQGNESNRSYPAEQTPLYTKTEEDERKGKKFSQKEKDELKDYYKKAYNLDDDKAQTLIDALERGYIAQSNDKQYAEAGVSDVEFSSTNTNKNINQKTLSTSNNKELLNNTTTHNNHNLPGERDTERTTLMLTEDEKNIITTVLKNIPPELYTTQDDNNSNKYGLSTGNYIGLGSKILNGMDSTLTGWIDDGYNALKLTKDGLQLGRNTRGLGSDKLIFIGKHTANIKLEPISSVFSKIATGSSFVSWAYDVSKMGQGFGTFDSSRPEQAKLSAGVNTMSSKFTFGDGFYPVDTYQPSYKIERTFISNKGNLEITNWHNGWNGKYMKSTTNFLWNTNSYKKFKYPKLYK